MNHNRVINKLLSHMINSACAIHRQDGHYGFHVFLKGFAINTDYFVIIMQSRKLNIYDTNWLKLRQLKRGLTKPVKTQ